jgi:hypothetical protein
MLTAWWHPVDGAALLHHPPPVSRFPQAFAQIFVSTEDVKYRSFTPSEEVLVTQLRGVLHLNRAAAKLKMEGAAGSDADWDASQV